VFLYEPVTPKVMVALGLLLAAIAVLSYGAGEAGRLLLPEDTPIWRLALGTAAACLSGTAYAVLNVVMRHCMMRGAPVPTMLLTVSVVGLLSLGFLSWLRIGQAGVLATQPRELLLMLAAGLCNTVAFVALTKSLQLTSVVYVNSLSAIQAMLAALVGIVIFNERLTSGLAVGVLLTIAGLMALARAHRKMREPATAAN
jgi:drug/metabolite transporter (DMT)-like permease